MITEYASQERQNIIPEYKIAPTKIICAPKMDKARKLLNKVFP